MVTRSNLVENLAKSMGQAEEKVAGYRSQHNRIMMTTMISSGASTLIAGVTSAVGEAASIGTEGWRLACIIAAVFGFVATISSGISQQKNLYEKLSESNECFSRLRYLNSVIVTGSKDRSEINREYEDLMIKFPDIMG